MTRAARRPSRAPDPYGIGPVGSLIGPALSIVGLIVIAILTINLFNYDIPFLGSGGNDGGNGPIGADRTPAPSNVIIVPEQAKFEGSIVYAKQGNIWIQEDKAVRQLTTGGGDSMPSWSPDGQSVIFIRSHDDIGYWPVRGRNGRYDISVPEIMLIKADGSSKPQRLASGLVRRGQLKWAAWMRQPVLSPDGKTIALVTDAPAPDQSDVVLQFLTVSTKKLTPAGVRENQVLGHQDPEWRPDGKFLLYTQNGRDGAKGAPVIMRYEPVSRKARAVTTTGYMQASYSPDGRYMAATRTTTLGTDVVIMDANSGRELMRITNDGSSWAPSWSPAGDGIAFLHIVGQTVDLRLARLTGDPGAWTVSETIDLTEVSGLDAASRPDWYIPPALLPALPTPAPSDGSAAPSDASPSP